MVRHTAKTKVKAQELVAAGWSIREAQRILEGEGLRVSTNVIWTWTSPLAERRREIDRVRHRAARRSADTYRWPGVRTVDWRLGRMRALHEAGLSHGAIAKVMTVDFPGEPLTRHQVVGVLMHGHMPRSLRSVAA